MTLRSVAPWPFALVLAGAVATSIACAVPATAQSVVSTTTEDVTLGLRLATPFIPGDAAPSPWSSTLETDLLFRWGANAFVQVGMPLAFAGADFADGTSVYLGSIGALFVFGAPGAPTSFLGFTLPSATNLAGPDVAVLIGTLQAEDEPELWGDDLMSVRGGIIPTVQLSEAAQVGVRIGGSLVAPNDLEDLWLYARGGPWASARAGAAELRGDLVTSYFINSDDTFERKFRMYLDAKAELVGLPGRPGIFLRIPLDREARDAIDFSAGVSARFGL